MQNENGDEYVDFNVNKHVDDIKIIVADEDEVNSHKLFNSEKKTIIRKSFDINSLLGTLVPHIKYKILSKALFYYKGSLRGVSVYRC